MSISRLQNEAEDERHWARERETAALRAEIERLRVALTGIRATALSHDDERVAYLCDVALGSMAEEPA